MTGRKLVLLVGIPGSGKSTFAKTLLNSLEDEYVSGIICSADDYFIRPDGVYDWNPKMLKNAHKWCQNKADEAMDTVSHHNLSYELVIIDNTNLKKKDRQVYIDMAKKYGYKVEEIVVGKFDEESIKEYAKRNVHGVPLETIQRMAEKYEKV